MKRELLIARGLVVTGLWELGAGTAGATTYDYGVGVWQQYDNTAPSSTGNVKRSSGQYCFPVACLAINGTKEIHNSQTNSIQGTSYYPYKTSRIQDQEIAATRQKSIWGRSIL